MRRITMTVEITDKDNGDVAVRITKPDGTVLAMGTNTILRCSMEIGAIAFEYAEEVGCGGPRPLG